MSRFELIAFKLEELEPVYVKAVRAKIGELRLKQWCVRKTIEYGIWNWSRWSPEYSRPTRQTFGALFAVLACNSLSKHLITIKVVRWRSGKLWDNAKLLFERIPLVLHLLVPYLHLTIQCNLTSQLGLYYGTWRDPCGDYMTRVVTTWSMSCSWHDVCGGRSSSHVTFIRVTWSKSRDRQLVTRVMSRVTLIMSRVTLIMSWVL